MKILNIFLLKFSEEKSRQRIKDLTQQIQSVRQEKITELAKRAEVIAYQKDQLQEAKAKAQLEITYEKKKCENYLEQVRARCAIAEHEMRRDQDVTFPSPNLFTISRLVQSLENRTEDEMKSNSETENYLRVYIKVFLECFFLVPREFSCYSRKQFKKQTNGWRNTTQKQLPCKLNSIN